MKELVKKIIPNQLLKWYRNRNTLDFRNKSANKVFTEIYKSNFWGAKESVSGHGSELSQTESLIIGLDKLLKDMNITSVLDLPCGDFNWMRKVDISKVDYVGADIVEELIKSNIRQYSMRENLKFQVLNLITDQLPESDMIIVRDCFVHLSYEDIDGAIKNIKSSNSKYLLTTTYLNCYINNDIVTGNWRPLNLQKEPFSFPSPILVINENPTEDNKQDKSKCMALWDISKL